MAEKHSELVERLDDAAAALNEALDVITEHYGCGHPLFDKAVEARDTATEIGYKLASE